MWVVSVVNVVLLSVYGVVFLLWVEGLLDVVCFGSWFIVLFYENVSYV